MEPCRGWCAFGSWRGFKILCSHDQILREPGEEGCPRWRPKDDPSLKEYEG